MSYFTMFRSFLLPSFNLSGEEQRKLDMFLQILEDSGVATIIQKALRRGKNNGGRNPYNPYRLFATIIYAFSKHSGSLRKIEESINFDLRFIYLMQQERPSYVTISKFLNNVVVKSQDEIFSCIVKRILLHFNICIDDVFIDGTKIEANANKTKFVWRPTAFQKKLDSKIKTELTKHFNMQDNKTNFIAKEVADYISALKEKIAQQGIELEKVSFGRGHRNPDIVSSYKRLTELLLKKLEYEERESICGDGRNSYYKTDKDATAMNMKSDYYSGLGSNMKAGYNIQIIVAKGIVLEYMVSQDRNDLYAFIPTLNKFYVNYDHYPRRICADSGYGSLLNYRFLSENGIENYVKFQYWQPEVDGRHVELYSFDGEGRFVCLSGREGIKNPFDLNRHPRGKGNDFYLISNCGRCIFKDYCKAKLKDKASNTRIFEVNKELYDYKAEARKNLLSTMGIEMRVNRSSQVEGVFGVIKQDMSYDRIRRRGLENVSAEIMLVCLGYVLRKTFSLIEGKGKIEYWKAPDDLVAQISRPINLARLIKKTKKGRNETSRKSYKNKPIKKTVKPLVS